MRTVNMHDAKTNLSRLVEGATKGEHFIIARAGKPLVKVVALEAGDDTDAAAKAKRRFGFMRGEFTVPDDIKTPFKDEIEEMFHGEPDKFT